MLLLTLSLNAPFDSPAFWTLGYLFLGLDSNKSVLGLGIFEGLNPILYTTIFLASHEPLILLPLQLLNCSFISRLLLVHNTPVHISLLLRSRLFLWTSTIHRQSAVASFFRYRLSTLLFVLSWPIRVLGHACLIERPYIGNRMKTIWVILG